MSESPLLRMSRDTTTCLWNDSADPGQLTQAIGWGAVGATCNPVLALSALNADLPRWQARIAEFSREFPTASESEIGWKIVRELSVNAATLLEPAFESSAGINGRLSIQTDPRLYRDDGALAEQAVEFSELAKNMIVKIPVTTAGVAAIEEATYRGVSINATVSFTVAQSIAVAEAVERGLVRREKEGLDITRMGPVCTIMVGRLDDWLRVVAERDQITIDPGHLEWAGVAVFKRAYEIFQERGFRIRLLSAAFRNHMHWSEFIGGDVVISPPFNWQERINASGIEPVARINAPVAAEVLATLLNKFGEFRKAYEPDGLAVSDFTAFGPTRRTLRQFLEATSELEALVRNVTVPNPDRL